MSAGKKVGAVVLAAGQSRRMGRQKLLLPWGSHSVIEQVIRILVEAEICDIVVVTGAEHEKINATLVSKPKLSAAVRLVQNPDFANSEMLASLQIGIRALNTDCDALLIVLGDQPTISARVVRAVVDAYRSTGASLVIPSFQMRRGHPWLVDRSNWDALLALTASQTLRDFLDHHKSQIHYVALDAPEILEDLDTPEDYQRLHRQDDSMNHPKLL